MSRWCHVVGCLYIETFKETKGIKKYVENKIKDAPLITGSEADADIFVNPLSGHNVSVWDRVKETKYQTCVAITIVGNLRDTENATVEMEIKNFIKYIEDLGFDIYYKSISIYDTLLEKPIIIEDKEEDYYG